MLPPRCAHSLSLQVVALSAFCCRRPEQSAETSARLAACAYSQRRCAGNAEACRREKTDIVYDLGCGDGRIVVAAALPSVNLRLRPKWLAELKPRTRVVSHTFDMGDGRPLKQEPVAAGTLYLWVIPEKE